MNQYIIDKNTPTLISFSGGRTSAYMLYKIYEANDGIPDNCYIVFANTGKERIETLEFIHEIENDLNIRIYWIEYCPNKIKYTIVDYETASRNGEPFQALNRYTTGLPNPVQRSCTSNLKVIPMHKFMANKIGKEVEFISFIGIRYDEPKRWRVEDNVQNKYCENVIPLKYAKVTESDVLEFWASRSFDLQLVKGEGNCDLCYLKSAKLLSSIIERNPKLANWWIKQEAFSCGNNGKESKRRTFRSDRPNYEDLKHIALSQDAFNFTDEDTIPCMCHD